MNSSHDRLQQSGLESFKYFSCARCSLVQANAPTATKMQPKLGSSCPFHGAGCTRAKFQVPESQVFGCR